MTASKLVGIKDIESYFNNKNKIKHEKREICSKKNKDKYYLMRIKCKMLLKKLNIY